MYLCDIDYNYQKRCAAYGDLSQLYGATNDAFCAYSIWIGLAWVLIIDLLGWIGQTQRRLMIPELMQQIFFA